MEATQLTTEQMPPGRGTLAEVQVPMINTLVSCLSSEHRRLDEHVLLLALAATRLVSNPGEPTAKARALEAWDEIRHELWSHLQIEDAFVNSIIVCD
jgi:hypothetical protein